jgi:hypothetical protein
MICNHLSLYPLASMRLASLAVSLFESLFSEALSLCGNIHKFPALQNLKILNIY